MTAKETLDLISKQWANTTDIQKIGCIGKEKALKIKHQIQIDMKQMNLMLPNERLVPMKKVVEYFGIDINYLKKIERENK